MYSRRATGLGALLFICAALPGCAGRADDSDEAAILALSTQDVACPPARLLADTDHLTGSLPGEGADRPAVAYDADLVSATTECRRDKDSWIISVRVRATAGAIGTAAASTVSLPVFLALTEYERTVLDKKVVELPVRFDPGAARIVVEKTVDGLVAPAAGLHPGPGYEILIGFQLSPEQLERNRRGRRARD